MKTTRPELKQQQVCGVCGQAASRIRCGVLACEGCKKFFLRHRQNHAKLICTIGDGNCNAKAVELIALNPNFRRQFCQRCRLEKCLEIGMRSGAKPINRQQSSSCTIFLGDEESRMIKADENNSSWSAASSSTASLVSCHQLTKSPIRFECAITETMLQKVMASASKLSTLRSIPFTFQSTSSYPTESEIWQHAMSNFEGCVKISANYVKSFEEFAELPLSDRCQLFSGAVLSQLIVQVTQPGLERWRYFGMSEPARDAFVSCFPPARIFFDEINRIAQVMQAWNPSFTEMALLQAFLFFRTANLDKLNRPDLVVKTNEQLRVAMIALSAKRGIQAKDERMRLFQHVYELLFRFEALYREGNVVMANMRPDLRNVNKLFFDIYSLPIPEREQRYTALGLPAL